MDDIAENIKSESQWLRLLFMIAYAVVYNLAEIIVILLAVFQFVFAILTGSPNRNLTRLGDSFGQFIAQIVHYLTYKSDERPFPFADWPTSDSIDEDESAVEETVEEIGEATEESDNTGKGTDEPSEAPTTGS